MSNIKLKDHNWATDGIYDTQQEATQKALNTELVERGRNIIKVQDTQPASTYNQIWLPETVGDGTQVPTWAEHQALSNTVSALGTGDITNGSNVSGATATAALNTLNGAITSLGSDDIANDSTNVSGLKVTNALDTLNTAINALETTVGGTVGIGTEAGLIRESCFFNATANISLGSTGVTIEQYARGEIVSADGITGCIIAVGYGSKAYFAFFESGIIRTAKIFTTDSPTFTGTPTAPTPISSDSSTKIATTAFVQGHVSDLNTAINALETTVGGTVGIGTEAGLIRKSCFFNATANISLGSTGVTLEAYARGAIISADGETGSIVAVGYSGRIYTAFFTNGVIQNAQINQTESPAFSGIPTAPTASSGTNTTQIATTAFVQNALNYTQEIIILNNKSNASYLYKIGHICIFQSPYDFDSVAAGYNVIGQLPNGYFPTVVVRTNITNISGGLNFVNIDTNGQIGLYSDQASAGVRNGAFWAMWVIA